MTICYLISKYDAAQRAGEVDAWTSFDDIGKSFDGKVLTAEEYRSTEDLYVRAVESLARSVGVGSFELRNVILNEPAPSWAGDVHEGRTVDLGTALRLVRSMLRGSRISCVLESGTALRLGVETDYYLSVEIQPEAVEALDAVERLGLHVGRIADAEEDDEPSQVVSRPADAGFWQEVTLAARAGGPPVLVLERWAQGSCGHRWYLIEDGDLSPVAGSVRPQSLVTAFFGLTVHRAARGDLLRSVAADAVEDPRMVIFSGSAGDVLETLTCGEGVPLPTEEELPGDGETGWFLWPDESETAVPPLWAVVPAEDGRITAGWPDPVTG